MRNLNDVNRRKVSVAEHLPGVDHLNPAASVKTSLTPANASCFCFSHVHLIKEDILKPHHFLVYSRLVFVVITWMGGWVDGWRSVSGSFSFI